MEDVQTLVKAFFLMLEEYDFEKEFFLYEPISYLSFKNMSKRFIDYMKDACLIGEEYTEEDMDMEYIEGLVESLIYGLRMFFYCTYFCSDKSLFDIKCMSNSTRNAFYTLGYTNPLQLALIFANTTDSKNLPGIGPKRYKEFQEFMCVKCEDFQVYAPEEK
jgi:hypothetical protein